MSESLEDKFRALGLDDSAQQEYATSIAREEEGEDRVEAILGLIEGLDEDEARPLVEDLLRALDAARVQEAESAKPVEHRPVKTAIRAPSPEPQKAARPARELTEDERTRRERLLRQYGNVEEAEDETPELAPSGATAKTSKAKGKTETDDLFVNDNTANVKAAEVAKRDAAAKQAAAKREKDKADLIKQRADQAKRKEEARKKAARSERKA